MYFLRTECERLPTVSQKGDARLWRCRAGRVASRRVICRTRDRCSNRKLGRLLATLLQRLTSGRAFTSYFHLLLRLHRSEHIQFLLVSGPLSSLALAIHSLPHSHLWQVFRHFITFHVPNGLKSYPCKSSTLMLHCCGL